MTLNNIWTIWSSCLSPLLLLLLHPRQIRNVCYPPDTLICTQLKYCMMMYFGLRNNLCPNTLPILNTNYVPGDEFSSPIGLVPLQSYNSIISTRKAKAEQWFITTGLRQFLLRIWYLTPQPSLDPTTFADLNCQAK